ncbi:MAG: sterol-binding protein [Actinobacteria bacterium]|nr:sterol-binding protein [Actinomycetota bacterium]
MTLESERSEVISYKRLYRLWEENGWSATGLDFSTDAKHWDEMLTDRQREAALWNYAMFLIGEEAVARTLSPVLDAAPTHEQKIFLTTQIVDEARHHVFFDRFMREVAGQGTDIDTTLSAVDGLVTWGFRQIFDELDRVTDALRKKPNDRALLAQSVALYHVVVEGMLAIPGQHFIQRYVEKMEILPAFSEGITNVSRDESRHVAFGIRFLGELVASSTECRSAAIEMFDRVLPWAVGVFVPPNLDPSYAECFDFTLEEIYAFGLRSFETKLNRLGIDPNEISLLSRDDSTYPYDERARRMWVLIRCGIIGDEKREPEVSPEALGILFEGLTNMVDLDVARSLGGPIEFDLTDAEKWHVEVNNGHAEARSGAAHNPALTLQSTAADWAKISVNRMDPRKALLTRKLKVHGSLSSKAKLPKLFAF